MIEFSKFSIPSCVLDPLDKQSTPQPSPISRSASAFGVEVMLTYLRNSLYIK